MPADDSALTELRQRLAEVSDLERAAMLLAWDQEVAMPQAGAEAWTRARAASDFALFEPHLRRNVELRRGYVACFPDAERAYDALLDDYEPGMRTAQAHDVLVRLRDGL